MRGLRCRYVLDVAERLGISVLGAALATSALIGAALAPITLRTQEMGLDLGVAHAQWFASVVVAQTCVDPRPAPTVGTRAADGLMEEVVGGPLQGDDLAEALVDRLVVHLVSAPRSSGRRMARR